jgi:hypothetical protein
MLLSDAIATVLSVLLIGGDTAPAVRIVFPLELTVEWLLA